MIELNSDKIHIIEGVNIFKYFGYTITLTSNRDLEIKMTRIDQM
jgi:hypothetical protein